MAVDHVTHKLLSAFKQDFATAAPDTRCRVVAWGAVAHLVSHLFSLNLYSAGNSTHERTKFVTATVSG